MFHHEELPVAAMLIPVAGFTLGRFGRALYMRVRNAIRSWAETRPY